MKELIPINQEVLTWARERAGYQLDKIVKTKTFSKSIDWENGISYPSYSQLEALAKKYKIPLAVFFFPHPPKESPIEKSLRAVSQEDVHNLNPQIRFLFRKAKAFQIYLNDLFENEQENNKLYWLKQKTPHSPAELAKHVRKSLNISVETQTAWKDENQALEEWRNILAKNGIYVFKDAFKDNKISGFCIYDDFFPVIYLNNSLSKNRQIFTIFHELAHLLFKQNYLDVFNESSWTLNNNIHSNTEAKCNEFAGHFLVPDDAFKTEYQTSASPIQEIERFSELYKVSKEVILRKFLNLHLINQQYYEEKLKEWGSTFKNEHKPDHEKPGGNFYSTKLQYLGSSYLNLVFKKYYQGKIDFERASEYLDVKPKSFFMLEETLLKKELYPLICLS